MAEPDRIAPPDGGRANLSLPDRMSGPDVEPVGRRNLQTYTKEVCDRWVQAGPMLVHQGNGRCTLMGMTEESMARVWSRSLAG